MTGQQQESSAFSMSLSTGTRLLDQSEKLPLYLCPSRAELSGLQETFRESCRVQLLKLPAAESSQHMRGQQDLRQDPLDRSGYVNRFP